MGVMVPGGLRQDPGATPCSELGEEQGELGQGWLQMLGVSLG